MMFASVFAKELNDYYALRKASQSQKGLAADCTDLGGFDRYLAESGLSEKVLTEEALAAWINSLTCKRSTLSSKIARIRGFIKYLNAIGITAFLPELPKAARDFEPYIYTDNEVDTIIAEADNTPMSYITPGSRIHYSEAMLIRVLYGCGLRLGEALALQMKDVDLEGGILTLLHTKGNVERIVPMHPTLNEILHRYCLAMGLIGDPDAYVFPGMTNDYAITKDCAQGRFERILKRVAIEKKGKKPHERGPCLHCFRNVFILKSIMQAEKSGVSINVHSTYLPTYLGHKSMLNTDRYIRFRNTRFPETLMAFEEFTDGIFPEVCDE